jgi:hypothetical protein
VVDATQDWFLSAAWQEGEKAASADIAAGRITRYYSDEEFLASFDWNPAAIETPSRTGATK